MLTWREVDIIVRDMERDAEGWVVMAVERRASWVIQMWKRETGGRATITSWEGWRTFVGQMLPGKVQAAAHERMLRYVSASPTALFILGAIHEGLCKTAEEMDAEFGAASKASRSLVLNRLLRESFIRLNERGEYVVTEEGAEVVRAFYTGGRAGEVTKG